LKFLFITHYGGLYGANRSLLTLAKICKENGFSCRFLIPGISPFSKVLQDCEFEFYIRKYLSPYLNTKQYNLFNRLTLFLKKPAEVFRTLKVIKNYQPDIIYSNSSAVDIGYLASKITGVKHFWHIREFGLLDYDVKPFYGSIYKRIIGRNRQSVYVSKKLQEYYSKSKLGTVLYNGVEASNNVNVKFNEQSENLTFGYVGLVTEKKGCFELFDYWKAINMKLVVRGSHLNSEEKITTVIKKNPNIFYEGEMDNVDSCFKGIDVLIVPSYNEAFGRVIIEAFARGVLVISRNAGAFPEIIVDGDNGYLFSSMDELGKRLRKLDREQCNSIIATALNDYDRKYSIRALENNFIKIVKSEA